MLSKKQIQSLDEYCFVCGQRYTKEAIDGGRCRCGAMVCAATTKEIVAEFNAAPKKIQNQITAKIDKRLLKK
jgi:hypothetical protein